MCACDSGCHMSHVGSVGLPIFRRHRPSGHHLYMSTKASTLHEHVATRQGRHKGAGKGASTSCFELGCSARCQGARALIIC
eukprot:scaffold24859_cov129-Isochrysis_galbana.AAC.1